MGKTYPKFRAAAVQAAPVFLDLDATVEKTCKLIEEAANNGATLVAFPESFIPGYPWWIWLGDPGAYGAPYYAELYKNAVEIPGKAVSKISEAAKNTGTYVCVSVTELDGGSLYLTQLWFDPNGNLMGKHRKLKPTGAERYIWGEGDGSMMKVFDTEIGNLGGLQCWEHMIPLNIAAMNSLNEQVHVGSWPAFSCNIGTLFTEGPNVTASKYYSAAAGCFTLMSTQIITQEMIDKLCQNDYQRQIIQQGGGCTQIISPESTVISNIVPKNEEGFAYADIDLEMIVYCKYAVDPAGHYSVPGILSLDFNQNYQPAVRKSGQNIDLSISYNTLQKSESTVLNK
ncbi:MULTISPECIES: carbon-nitrogen hydrolase family protein [unclassified Fictibacillus]|uniref:carbon-nitrogen hydrolase family protein n=1 Tax=unclassified Fictibacillus TaxID=2644029 RepID=UPI00078121DB|nr:MULTISPECIES: carbon-nitrogen hydrolase family protein [unclassified Fictibacillus]UZJ80546.1 carbon-nitrogen hydrolase family protein [Fictibacillus sp. KU28468]SFE42219.1 cyanide dihydratase [Bacillus sp. OV194]